jgi:hypothetical protein
MENAGIFRGHLEYFTVIWYILLPFDNVVVIWNFFSRFGKLCQEKSGNPAVELATNVLNHTNAAKICMYIGCGKLFEIASRFQNVENIPNDLKTSPGGVAQLTSHPPEEQKTWVRIPPGYKVFLGSHSNAVVCYRLTYIIRIDCVLRKRELKALAPKKEGRRFGLAHPRFFEMGLARVNGKNKEARV